MQITILLNKTRYIKILEHDKFLKNVIIINYYYFYFEKLADEY